MDTPQPTGSILRHPFIRGPWWTLLTTIHRASSEAARTPPRGWWSLQGCPLRESFPRRLSPETPTMKSGAGRHGEERNVPRQCGCGKIHKRKRDTTRTKKQARTKGRNRSDSSAPSTDRLRSYSARLGSSPWQSKERHEEFKVQAVRARDSHGFPGQKQEPGRSMLLQRFQPELFTGWTILSKPVNCLGLGEPQF